MKQNNVPLISVIIPVYNVEKYLSQCLNSVINQTYKNLEIICVNDGSLDNSEQILNLFASKDSRIKVLKQKNKGQSTARNNGLKHSHGEWVSFIDSDDWISKNYYEELLKACQTTGAEISYANIIYSLSNKQFSPLIHHTNDMVFDNFEDMLNYQNNGSVCSKLFKRSILFDKDNLKFEFPVGLRWEDCLFLIQALKNAHKECCVQLSSYYYRRNRNSTMLNHDNQWRNMEDRKKICAKIWEIFKSRPEYHKCVINFMINVVFAKSIVQTNEEIRHYIEELCGISICVNQYFKITKVAWYLFGVLQLFRYNRDEYVRKLYVLYIPVFKHTIKPEQCFKSWYIFNLLFIEKYHNKIRFCLFSAPILKIRRDDIFGIYLFNIFPIIKIKRTK